jgi:hypothetical protein
MNSDSAKKQYFIFSLIISLVLSFIINFFFSGALEGPYVSGFPFTLTDLSGFEEFMKRVFNTLFMSVFLVVPVYYGLIWLQNRR